MAAGWTEQGQQSRTGRQDLMAESLVALWEKLMVHRRSVGNGHASSKMGLVMD